MNPMSHMVRDRRGVSLLEVLISMFVMMVGLLGMAALLPVGRQSAMEATKADRVGACGRAAEREIRVRDMLNSQTWLCGMLTSGMSKDRVRYTAVSKDSYLDTYNALRPFVIDPLLFPMLDAAGVTNASNPDRRFELFPFGQSLSNGALPRISLAVIPLATKPQRLTLAAAFRIFSANDDLTFDLPASQSQRPTYPIDPTTGTYYAVQPIEGYYSWMATCQPVVDATAGIVAYRVSIVVHYRRNAMAYSMTDNTQAERAVPVSSMLSSGFGGGDVMLNVSNVQLVSLRPNNWVMLANRPTTERPNVMHQWYRVVSWDPDTRIVTLEGPDWPQWDLTKYGPPIAVIVPSVAGVYTTTIPAAVGVPWSTN